MSFTRQRHAGTHEINPQWTIQPSARSLIRIARALAISVTAAALLGTPPTDAKSITKSAKAKSSGVKSSRVRSFKVRSRRAKSSGIKSSRIKSSRIKSSRIKRAKLPKPTGVWGWTTGSRTYLRVRPSATTPAVAKVPRRTKLFVWGKYDGWYRVETPDHNFGWVYHRYVNAPREHKIGELSHRKAKLASDRTDDHQTLYGSPKLLRRYYARYRAPGAIDGLQQQGIHVAGARRAERSIAKRSIAKPSIAKRSISRRVAMADNKVTNSRTGRTNKTKDRAKAAHATVAKIPTRSAKSARVVSRNNPRTKIASTRIATATAVKATAVKATAVKRTLAKATIARPQRIAASDSNAKSTARARHESKAYRDISVRRDIKKSQSQHERLAHTLAPRLKSEKSEKNDTNVQNHKDVRPRRKASVAKRSVARALPRITLPRVSRIEIQPDATASGSSEPARGEIKAPAVAPVKTAAKTAQAATARAAKAKAAIKAAIAAKRLRRLARAQQRQRRKAQQRARLRRQMGLTAVVTPPSSPLPPISPEELMRARDTFLSSQRKPHSTGVIEPAARQPGETLQ